MVTWYRCYWVREARSVAIGWYRQVSWPFRGSWLRKLIVFEVMKLWIVDNCASRRFDKCLILMQWGRGISYRSFKYYNHQVHRIQKGSQIIYLYSPNIQDGIEPFSTVGITKCSRLNTDSIHTVGWCCGTTAHFLRRRLGVQTQSEAGSSGHQAVIGRSSHWSFESNARA